MDKIRVLAAAAEVCTACIAIRHTILKIGKKKNQTRQPHYY